MSPLALLAAAALGQLASPGPSGAAGAPLPAVRALPGALPTATTAAKRPLSERPRVALFPTHVREPPGGLAALAPSFTQAFSDELLDAAAAVFAWRRFELVPDEELLGALAREAECQDSSCYGRLALELGANHWVASALIRAGEDLCLTRVVLFDVLREQTIRQLERDLRPCSANNLLVAAAELGQQIADGEQAPAAITLRLTPLPVAHLDIPDVSEIARHAVDTSTRARTSGLSLERALELYRDQHMFIFESDDGRDYYVVRNGKLLTECDARRAATAPLPDELRDYCDGNDWEWAWLGLPAGGLLMLGSSSGLQEGDTVSVFGFGLGLITAGVTTALALLLNEDAKSAEDARYLSGREAMERLVENANAQLRRTLDLSEAEVVVAGMRL